MERCLAKGLRALAWLGLLTFAACRTGPEATPQTTPSVDVAAIRSVVDMYIASVDAADPVLARRVWAERDDISFIHPLGHEEGWAQIKSNVYQNLMGGMFSERKLTIERIAIKPHGQSAVVEFYWVFHATLRKDGRPVTTRGRETQVLLKDVKGDWRLAHVHFSGMPPNNLNPVVQAPGS